MLFHYNKATYERDYALKVICTFRRLWSQHITWSRFYLVSTVSKLDDLEYVTNRFIKNSHDFTFIIKTHYNYTMYNTFEKLLTEHILITSSLFDAKLQTNMDEYNTIKKSWYKNAEEIAGLFEPSNPYLPKRIFQPFLYDLLKLLEEEMSLCISHNYTSEIKLFDSIEELALAIADFMAFGTLNYKYGKKVY